CGGGERRTPNPARRFRPREPSLTTARFAVEVASIVLLVLVAFGGWGYNLADKKGRWPGEGAILGFLLGPLGVLIERLLPRVDEPLRERTAGEIAMFHGFVPMERTQERRR